MRPVSRRHTLLGGALVIVVGMSVWNFLHDGGPPATASAAPAEPSVQLTPPKPDGESSEIIEKIRTRWHENASKPDPRLDHMPRDLFVATAWMKGIDVAAGANESGVREEATVDQAPATRFVDQHQLQGVVMGRVPFAVIDGLPFRPGAHLDGFVLSEIHRESVVFRQGPETVTLALVSPQR